MFVYKIYKRAVSFRAKGGAQLIAFMGGEEIFPFLFAYKRSSPILGILF